MQRAAVVLTLLIALTAVVQVQAQFKGLDSAPTPTPTPAPKPAPSATPPTEPKPVPCPKVSVQAQARGMIRDGQPISFVANIAGGDPKVQPTILWNLSAGLITEGQSTRRITVDTTGAGETFDREIKADIWVGGYAPECVLQATATAKIIAAARKFGDFGELPAETVSFHMKTLAEKVGDSADTIFVIGYAGRKSERGFAAKWLGIMRAELVTNHKLSPRRINVIDGGFREEPLFDFWIVPPGAMPPRPQPTVDRREIVFPKISPPARQP